MDHEAVGKELTTILESEEIIQEIENFLNGKRGTRREVYFPQPIARTYDFIAWRLPNLTAPATAWAMVVLHDITEVKMSDRMRADFVANVSHEIRSMKNKAYKYSKEELMELIEKEENKIIKKQGWKWIKRAAMIYFGIGIIPGL